MTYGLAIHTGSPELGFAIDDFNGDCRSAAWNLGRESSTQLHERLLKFLAPQTWPDLGWIAVAIGPGGFTGTRLGVVLARTLAQQLKIPLFGVSTLMAIADANGHSGPVIAVQMPAQRGQLYGGMYQQIAAHQYEIKIADSIFQPPDWEHQLVQFPDIMRLEAMTEQGRFAPNLLAIAHQQWQINPQSDWATVLPYYGQHPVQT